MGVGVPFRFGEALPADVFAGVRKRTIFEHCKWDAQHEDRSVLAPFALLLEQQAWVELQGLAEALSGETLAAERELRKCERLHRSLGLSRAVRRILRRNECEDRGIARVMRFDFHFTSNGWRISEVNADVPGGFVEAGGFTSLMASLHPGARMPANPGQAYAQCLRSAIGPGGTVALIHATAHSDDRQVMEYLARDFRHAGLKTLIASPAHVTWSDGQAAVTCEFARTVPDVLVRFFPGEWLPNLRRDSMWAPWFGGSKTYLSNPGAALLVQSKRFPLTWPHLGVPLPTWTNLLPEASCPSTISPRELREWVLKPAFGRVGEDVAIAGVTPEKEWRACRRAARLFSSHWVAQRRFQAIPVRCEEEDRYASLGVFTVDGVAAGIYGRISRKPLIDQEAQDVAVLIEAGGQDFDA